MHSDFDISIIFSSECTIGQGLGKQHCLSAHDKGGHSCLKFDSLSDAWQFAFRYRSRGRDIRRLLRATRPTLRRRSVAYGVVAIFRVSPTRHCHLSASLAACLQLGSCGDGVDPASGHAGGRTVVAYEYWHSLVEYSRQPNRARLQGLVKAKSSRRATNTVRNYNDRSSTRRTRPTYRRRTRRLDNH